MGFEIRKKRRFKKTEKFVKRMKEVYEKAEVALRKNQEDM